MRGVRYVSSPCSQQHSAAGTIGSTSKFAFFSFFSNPANDFFNEPNADKRCVFFCEQETEKRLCRLCLESEMVIVLSSHTD